MLFDSKDPHSAKLSEMSRGAFWFTLISVMLITAMFASSGTAYVMTRTLATKTVTSAKITKDVTSLNQRLQKVETALTKKKTTLKDENPTALTPMDVVRNGGGTERPLIHQITANPALVDLPACHNKPTAKQRIGCNAHLLATLAGIIDWKFGEEMRVISPDTVAFKIEKDAAGNLKIAQYAVSMAHGTIVSSSLVRTYDVAPTIATSHFIGPMDGSTAFQTAHLYMYTG